MFIPFLKGVLRQDSHEKEKIEKPPLLSPEEEAKNPEVYPVHEELRINSGQEIFAAGKKMYVVVHCEKRSRDRRRPIGKTKNRAP